MCLFTKNWVTGWKGIANNTISVKTEKMGYDYLSFYCALENVQMNVTTLENIIICNWENKDSNRV